MKYLNKVTGHLIHEFWAEHQRHMVVAVIIIMLGVASCSSDSDPVEPSSGGNVSSDPAIRDTELELVIKPGLLYKNIKTTPLPQDNCTTSRSAGIALPGSQSYSDCEKSFNAENGRIKTSALSLVAPSPLCVPLLFIFPLNLVGNCVLSPGYFQTVEARTSLIREFEVEQSGGESRALNGTISFNHAWLGRIVSLGVTGRASYLIDFRIRDVGLDTEIFRETLAENSVNGQIRKIGVKGVQIPVPVPGWSIDRTPDETFSRPIIIETGHRYRIQLRLRLTSKGSYEPGFGAAGWFSEPPGLIEVDFLSGFAVPGFLEWKDITIKLEKDI